MKVSRLNKTFPQAKLRRLEQAGWRQLTELLRHQSSPKLGVNDILNIWHLKELIRRQNSPKNGVFSRRLAWRFKEIQKPLKQLNITDVLLLKGHNRDV
ncbi:hypothetical protein TNCT_264971 [Trichonephila clavata]|uniref:Uncharacterized protein n=1 Tax=Trichonephila clavata TaxID=2740835 RepID=A0A8X6JG45_TRICU|nr:hypothetical protein TNCT_264971 [Trichonephila clavata]